MSGQNFIRKVIYMALMAALLLPLSLLSQPSTVAVEGRPATPGGILARERDEFKLGQGNLGKIDPASETIKLATLGMRGVAANLLWSKAEECKLKEDWTGLSATLEQIANLQPNYISVWRFQAWNLSYNISAEWDDYHDRYYWVIKGIEFLEKGIDYNAHEPRLLTDVGWFSSHKIGKSDERLQYRRLFREDDEFHARQRVHRARQLAVRQGVFPGGTALGRRFGSGNSHGRTRRVLFPAVHGPNWLCRGVGGRPRTSLAGCGFQAARSHGRRRPRLGNRAAAGRDRQTLWRHDPVCLGSGRASGRSSPATSFPGRRGIRSG